MGNEQYLRSTNKTSQRNVNSTQMTKLMTQSSRVEHRTNYTPIKVNSLSLDDEESNKIKNGQNN